ncbi:DNA primase [Patescibacteria group bacterium]|nr:DNA primase [Patescibacteria group bacterium]
MDQIEEIRSKIDLVQFISESVVLTKAGRNFKGLCPFHSEKTPSFMVSPERQIWHCFGCFPKGQLIKTINGLKSIEEIRIGDLVLTKSGQYKSVIRLLERKYQGSMVILKTRMDNRQVILTEDHEVFVIKTKNCKYKGRLSRLCQSRCDRYCPERYFKNYRVEKIDAKSLKEGQYLLYPIPLKVEEVTNIKLENYLNRKKTKYGKKIKEIPLEITVDEDFLKIIGYWIAEGSSHRAYLRFSLGNNEQVFADEIIRLVKKIFNTDAKICYRKNGKTGLEITACNSNLANIFENLCGKGAANKHIPFIFQFLPLEKQRILLEAIFKGDGYYGLESNTKNPIRYKSITTISQTLLEQLKDIVLRLGLFPDLNYLPSRKDKNNLFHRPSYSIKWHEKPIAHYSDFLEVNKEKFWILPIKDIIKKTFSGKVFNLTIDEDHSFVVNNFVVGNCGKGGNAFGFLMEMERIEFGEALRILAKKTGVKLDSYRPSKDESEKDKLFEINHLASEFYHYLLTSHEIGKKALNYILQRGITKDSLEKFKIGYSPPMWEGLQKYLVGKKGYELLFLEKAGLVIKSQRGNSYYDRFRDRLMFPLLDHRGNVTGFSGRLLDVNAKEAKYVNTPETLIYHKSELLYPLHITKEEIKKENMAAVVEGELDAISCFQVGIKNVVAIKGSALTEAQARLLKRFAENLVLSLDSDSAGDMASRRGIEIADKAGFNLKVVTLEKYKDPDEAAQKEPEYLKAQIENAENIYDFFISSAFKRYRGKTAEEKRKIGQELVPIFAKIEDEIVKDVYIKKLSQKLEVNEESIILQTQKVYKSTTVIQKQPDPVARKTRMEIFEEYLVALLFQGKETKELLSKETRSLISLPVYLKLIEKLEEFSKENKKFSSQFFYNFLPIELREAFDKLYLVDFGERIEDKEWLEKEIKATEKQLETVKIREEIKGFTGKLKNEEEEKETREKILLLTKKLATLEKVM